MTEDKSQVKVPIQSSGMADLAADIDASVNSTSSVDTASTVHVQPDRTSNVSSAHTPADTASNINTATDPASNINATTELASNTDTSRDSARIVKTPIDPMRGIYIMQINVPHVDAGPRQPDEGSRIPSDSVDNKDRKQKGKVSKNQVNTALSELASTDRNTELIVPKRSIPHIRRIKVVSLPNTRDECDHEGFDVLLRDFKDNYADKEERKDIMNRFRLHLFSAVITATKASFGYARTMDHIKDTGTTSEYNRYRERSEAICGAVLDKISLLSTIFNTIAVISSILALIVSVDAIIELFVFNLVEFFTLLTAIIIQAWAACAKNSKIARLREREIDASRQGHTIFRSGNERFYRIVDEVGEHYYASDDATDIYEEVISTEYPQNFSNRTKRIKLLHKNNRTLWLKKAFVPENYIKERWENIEIQTVAGTFLLEENALGAIFYYNYSASEVLPYHIKEVLPHPTCTEIDDSDGMACFSIQTYSYKDNNEIKLSYKLPYLNGSSEQIDRLREEEYTLRITEEGLEYVNNTGQGDINYDYITYRSIRTICNEKSYKKTTKIICAKPCEQSHVVLVAFMCVNCMLIVLSVLFFSFLIVGKVVPDPYDKIGHSIGLFTAFLSATLGLYFLAMLDNELKMVETRMTTREAYRDHVISQIYYMEDFKKALREYLIHHKGYRPQIDVPIDFQLNLLKQRYDYLSNLV